MLIFHQKYVNLNIYFNFHFLGQGGVDCVEVQKFSQILVQISILKSQSLFQT